MKRVVFFSIVVGTALVSSACSSSAPDFSDNSAAEPSDPLVVYSNSVSDGRGEYLQEQASEAGFEIEFVDLGGGDLMNRLAAEKNNPQADVVFGLNNVYFEKLVDEDVLGTYTPEWEDEVDATRGDGVHFWPIVREPIMGVYSLDAYPGGDGAPTDWPDLWEDEAFHGLYVTPTSLGGATPQMVVAGILSRYRDDSAALGVSDEGWQAIDSYFANGKAATEGVDLFAEFADGSASIGSMWLAGKAQREEEYGALSEAMTPDVGVPMVYQHVAITAETDQPTQAAEFLDWFGSAEVQAAWSNEFFTAPTNADALTDADQDAVAATDAFVEQDIDWAWVAEYLNQWVEEIELKYIAS